MAAPRERTDNRYDDAGGGGGFGKFRKRPQRRPHATPYDRPPTAVRNVVANAGGGGGGWLSRLVDPAQRLITSSAHRLFASVFRKRLAPAPPPPPPPQPPETEQNQGAAVEQREEVATKTYENQDAAIVRSGNPSNSSEGGGVSELELMLKKQTFTRTEIDRLTALLQSRLHDESVADLENKPEMLPSSAILPPDRKDRLRGTPVGESVLGSRLISSLNVVGGNVLPEEVASPAELAKAYMGGRPSSKVSPTKIGLLGQPLGESSTVPTQFPPKSPISALVPSSSGQSAFTPNGFVTPRSLGRSAIYSMARTPYSRGVSVNTLQAAGTSVDSLGGPSSLSQDTWRGNRSSGLRQGTLKRRSSVFENDIGAVGPIRRIRQKSNLLPASGILSVRGTGLGVDSSQQRPLKEKAVLTGEPLTKNGEDGSYGSGLNTVPSKSSQMASMILQKLDTMVSTRSKSPSKLSPSMLSGRALRSLENIDSSKFLEAVQDGNRLAGQPEMSCPVPQESVYGKKDMIEENGPTKSIVSHKDSVSAINNVPTSNFPKSDSRDVEIKALSVLNSAQESFQPKKRAFQMSAHEDYLEFDEGDSPSGPSTFTPTDGKEKSDAVLADNKFASPEILREEKAPTVAKVVSSSTSDTVRTSDGPGLEKKSGVFFPAVPVPSATVQLDKIDKQSAEAPEKPSSLNDSVVAPSVLMSKDSIASLKEPTATSSIFKAADKVPSFTFTSSSSLAYNSSGTMSESPSSLAVSTLATESAKKEPDSKIGTKDVLFRPPESSAASTSSVASSIFSFGGCATSSSLSNGSLLASPLFPSSNGSSSVAAVSTTPNNTTSSGLPISVSAPSSAAAPIFKFGAPSASSSSAFSASSSAAAESTEPKANGGNSGSLSSFRVGGTSTSFGGTGSNIFGGTSSAVSGATSLFGGPSSTISSTSISTPADTTSGSAIFSFNSGAAASDSTNKSQDFNPFTASTGQSSASVSNLSSSVSMSTPADTTSGSAIFSFDSGATASVSTNQSQGFNPFTASSGQSSAHASNVSSSVESISLPYQFGSSAPSTSFGLVGNAGFSSGSSFVSSSASNDKLFGSGSMFGLASSAPTSETNTLSSSSSATSSIFGSNWQTPKATLFSGPSSSSSSSAFVFGTAATSNSAVSSTLPVFGSSTSPSSGLPFTFGTPASATPPPPMFGNPGSSFAVGSSPSGNNDQMNMEDSMAEDTVQATPPTTALFGQQSMPSPSPGFAFSSGTPVNQFGSTAPGGASVFQFGGQPSMGTQPNPSPFQASGSLGSFSLGASGGDKSNRRIVKVKKPQRKR